MEPVKSKVYVLLDSTNRVIRCEGGYTAANILNMDEWVLIDEGVGDKYNLCQSHYFEGGLYTADGITRWKYAGGKCILRTAEEIEADRPEPIDPEIPETNEVTWDSMAEAITKGVNEV